MQLVLVRHGQSDNNVSYLTAVARHQEQNADPVAGSMTFDGVYARVPDPELTALGHRQAAALGRALRTATPPPFVPTHLYASPTLRAVATARPLSEATGLPIRLQPDAYEVGGIWDTDPATGGGLPLPGARLADLVRVGGTVQAPPDLFPAEGEPWDGGFEPNLEDALPRARRVLTALLSTHRRDDVVVLVSHQFFAQFLLAAALGWDSPPWRRFRVDNTGHLSLRMEFGETSAEWVNRVDHLDPADVTN